MWFVFVCFSFVHKLLLLPLQPVRRLILSKRLELPHVNDSKSLSLCWERFLHTIEGIVQEERVRY